MSKARVGFNRTLDSGGAAMNIWASGKSFVQNLTFRLTDADMEALATFIHKTHDCPFFLSGVGWELQIQFKGERIWLEFSESPGSDSKVRLSCFVSTKDFISGFEALETCTGDADGSD